MMQTDFSDFSGFSGFVLAGGKSSRMKRDKAFLSIGGETFLERAVRILQTVCREVKTVIDPNQAEKYRARFPFFDFIFDVYPERGAVGGIHSALTDCRTEYAFVLACDLPFVSPEAIDVLTGIAIESSDETAAVVPVQADGKIQPLCAVYRKNLCLSPVEKLLDTEKSVSMRDFLGLVRTEQIDWKRLGANENLFANINHPFEYESVKTGRKH